MDNFIAFLNGFNLQTIFTLGAMMWYFNHHVEKKIDKIEVDLKQQGARTDRLYEMFIDLLKNQKSWFENNS